MNYEHSIMDKKSQFQSFIKPTNDDEKNYSNLTVYHDK